LRQRQGRSVKYEDIYLKEYEIVPHLMTGLADYFHLYNDERPHQHLGRLTFTLLFMYRFCHPMEHLNFADLWSSEWGSP
jgi:hypothetical protein